MREGEMLISGGGKIDEMHLVTVTKQPRKVEGAKWVNDGPPITVEIEVRVEIDTAAVAHVLGRQAYRNRSHKSHDCGGLVRVRLEKVRS